MDELATIRFTDHDSGDDALIVVRASDEVLGLAVSLAANSDIAVFMGIDECKQLRDAIDAAITRMEKLSDAAQGSESS